MNTKPYGGACSHLRASLWILFPTHRGGDRTLARIGLNLLLEEAERAHNINDQVCGNSRRQLHSYYLGVNPHKRCKSHKLAFDGGGKRSDGGRNCLS